LRSTVKIAKQTLEVYEQFKELSLEIAKKFLAYFTNLPTNKGICDTLDLADYTSIFLKENLYKNKSVIMENAQKERTKILEVFWQDLVNKMEKAQNSK
jgi:hypothetical protein